MEGASRPLRVVPLLGLLGKGVHSYGVFGYFVGRSAVWKGVGQYGAWWMSGGGGCSRAAHVYRVVGVAPSAGIVYLFPCGPSVMTTFWAVSPYTCLVWGRWQVTPWPCRSSTWCCAGRCSPRPMRRVGIPPPRVAWVGGGAVSVRAVFPAGRVRVV